MRNHDRYESLAGAIALGEATFEEREAFVAHAADCALCRQDLADEAAGRSPLAAVSSARDEETWRPSLDRAIVARIREKSSKRSNFAVGALGWAAALSIAVNVAFVTGLTGQVSNLLNPTTEAPPITSFGIRLPAQTFARVPRATHPRGFALAAVGRAPRSAGPALGSFSATLAKAPIHESAVAAVQAADISDLLDANGTRSNRSVAIEITLPCNDARIATCGALARDARP